MSPKTIEKIKSSFSKIEMYIKGLKTLDGKLVLCGPRKRAFVGYLSNMHSLLNLYDDYVGSNLLSYLLTFKFCQDHIEMFFSKIRTGLGSNNNPTVLQFMSRYRGILIGKSLSGKFSSFSLLDESYMQILPSNPTECLGMGNGISVFS